MSEAPINTNSQSCSTLEQAEPQIKSKGAPFETMGSPVALVRQDNELMRPSKKILVTSMGATSMIHHRWRIEAIYGCLSTSVQPPS